jgi:hypothetical protein
MLTIGTCNEDNFEGGAMYALAGTTLRNHSACILTLISKHQAHHNHHISIHCSLIALLPRDGALGRVSHSLLYNCSVRSNAKSFLLLGIAQARPTPLSSLPLLVLPLQRKHLNMPSQFLENLPQEISAQIYSYILARPVESPSNELPRASPSNRTLLSGLTPKST